MEKTLAALRETLVLLDLPFILLSLLALLAFLGMKGRERLWFGRLISLALRQYVLNNTFRKGEELSRHESRAIQALRCKNRTLVSPRRRYYDAKP